MIVQKFSIRYDLVMRLIVIFCLHLLYINPVDATDISIPHSTTVLKYSVSGSGNHYPYYTNETEKPGILAEIVSEVLLQAKIQGISIEQPAKRTVHYLHSGLIDFDTISPDWLNGDEKQDERFVFSAPLIRVNEYVVTLPNFTSPERLLEAKPVGTIRGYYYHDDAHFERVDFASEKELVQALQMARVDRIIIGELPALYWANQLGVKIELKELHTSGFVHIRLLAKHRALLPKLNAAIATLKAQGRFAEIENQYLSFVPNTAVVHE